MIFLHKVNHFIPKLPSIYGPIIKICFPGQERTRLAGFDTRAKIAYNIEYNGKLKYTRWKANTMSPSDPSNLGKILVLFAIILAIIGFLLIALGKLPFFGKLPGDVVIRRGNSTFFFPIVTCILVSIVLTILINLFLWIFRR